MNGMETTTAATTAPNQHRFDPYDSNGGTILAISSKDYAIVASDTRQTTGFSIQTRYAPKCFQLTEKCVMSVTGFQADGNMLVRRVKQRLEWYQMTHNSLPELHSIARMVQTMLYGKRFFPYYTYVLLGGIESDGTGAVYSFDPVGSYEREACRCYGGGSSIIQPFLDTMINARHTTQSQSQPRKHPLRPEIPLDRLLAIVTDSFTGATERHIEVGDGLEIFIIKKKDIAVEGEGEGGTRIGAETEVVRKELKKD